MNKILCALLMCLPLGAVDRQEGVSRLFVLPACPSLGEKHLADLQRLVKKYPFAGILFMAGDASTQFKWIQSLQAHSRQRLLIFQDAEWGPAMRLKEQTPFPKALTLGAITDEKLLLEAGRGIGRACLRVGIDWNLAPVCDVNLNPKNPVIGMRSFGDNPLEVAHKVSLLIQGMREVGLLTCAKHFPGHGNSATDSHKDLPRIEGKREYPSFQAAIQEGVEAIMVGHLLFPEIDDQSPASLSHVVIEEELRQKMGFKGVVIPDSLCMAALTKYQSSEEILMGALRSGCDLFLFASAEKEVIEGVIKNIPLMIEQIAACIEQEDMDRRLSRLPLLARPLIPKGDEEALKRQLFRAALTEVGEVKGKRYLEVTVSESDLVDKIKALEKEGKEPCLILFDSPYILNDFPGIPALVAYEDNLWTREAVADYLTGHLSANGKLPIQVSGGKQQ